MSYQDIISSFIIEYDLRSANEEGFTLNELESLVEQIAADAEAVTVEGASASAVYSGRFGGTKDGARSVALKLYDDSSSLIAIIDETPLGLFLDPESDYTGASQFWDALVKANNGNEAAAKDVLYGTSNFHERVLFDIASEAYAANAVGPIIALVPEARPDRIFARTELEALLNNPNVTTINGIGRADLKSYFDTSAASFGKEHAAGNLNNALRTHFYGEFLANGPELRVGIDGSVEFSRSVLDDLGLSHIDPIHPDFNSVISEAFVDAADLESVIKTPRFGEGFDVLKAADALKYMGLAGDVITVAIALGTAADFIADGDWQSGGEVLAGVLGDFAGAAAGAWLVAPIASAFALGGPPGAVLGLGILAAGSIAGSLLGEAGARDLVNALDKSGLFDWFGNIAGSSGDWLRSFMDDIGDRIDGVLPEFPFGWPPSPPIPPLDPFVVDLDGDGIELISVDASSAHFDFMNDGFAERTGWLNSDDGFLFADANGNGLADGIDELFGSATQDGFAELTTVDDNQDGKIDASDAIFSSLRIWQDLNGDGVATTDEISTLLDHGIVSIGTDGENVSKSLAGNKIQYSGEVTLTDGSSLGTGAVFFARNTTLSKWVAPDGFEIDPDTKELPNLKGYGELRDLNAAMSLDSSLKIAVGELVDDAVGLSIASLKGRFNEILHQWAGADGSKLGFLETFFGSPHNTWGHGDADEVITPRFAEAIHDSFNEISDVLLFRFASQVSVSYLARDGNFVALAGSPLLLLGGLRYDDDSDSFAGAVPTGLLGAVLSVGHTTSRGYIQTLTSLLKGGLYDFSDRDSAILKAKIREAFATISDPTLALIAEEMISADHVRIGGDEDDQLGGGRARDLFIGNQGDDTFNGGSGNDTYLYVRGDGNDTIWDGGDSGIWDGSNDRLVFADLTQDNIRLERTGYTDITLNIVDETDVSTLLGSVTIKDGLDDRYDRGVERVEFSDGSIWTQGDIRRIWLEQAATDGDDVINGFNAADLITGGLGNDTLQGGAGSDTYIYARGDGDDEIFDSGQHEAYVTDSLVFSDINPDEVSLVRDGSHVTLVIAESAPGAGDGGSSIRLGDSLNPDYDKGLERVVFADETTWTIGAIRQMLIDQASTDGDDAISGFNSDDTLAGGLGDDTLNGFRGSDSYIYSRGDGDDVVTDSGSSESYHVVDSLIFNDINPDEVSLVRDGSYVTLVIAESSPGAGDGGSVRLGNSLNASYREGLEKIVFSDGTEWTMDTVRQNLMEQESTDGDDTIIGFGDADTIVGGLGNDILKGERGSDSYIYSRGDGDDEIFDSGQHEAYVTDVLTFTDINPADVTLVRDGYHVTIVVAESSEGAGDGGSIRLVENLKEDYGQGLERIVFADGTVWTRNDLRYLVISAAGTDGDDSISGTNAADLITGGLGNDTLQGGAGSDTYIYARGDGDDEIFDSGQHEAYVTDSLVFSDINPDEVSLVRDGSHVTLVIAESAPGAGDGGSSIRLGDSLNPDYDKGLERVVFADETTWTIGAIRQMLIDQASTDGDDAISGFNSDDTLAGGLGDDTLNGFRGSDSYIYSRGDGDDVVTDSGSSESYHVVDSLIFNDINPDEVSLVRDGSYVTLVIAESSPGAGDGGSVRLGNSLNASYREGLEKIVFSDGTEWTMDTVRQNLMEQESTDGDDTIIG
ncbi:calcium-binding protein, partial [Notoacmeibacter sp. MSK16QG-6]|uniref:calcium-binding protein n=1 Tax=Notoacmeibacter sp. MSK16QG-6 TaxID=2957982 RepID=UPI00273A6047